MIFKNILIRFAVVELEWQVFQVAVDVVPDFSNLVKNFQVNFVTEHQLSNPCL